MINIKSFFCTAFVVVTLIGFTSLAHADSNKNIDNNINNSEIYKNLRLFSEVFDIVRSEYVEQTDSKKLIEAAINGMLSSLDPHSVYMNVETLKEMSTNIKGEFGGLGIEINMIDNQLEIRRPIENTPASRAGIKSNDIILKINDVQTEDISLKDAIDKMRGPVGTSVTLTISRRGTPDPFEVTLIRDIIKVASVTSKTHDDIMYIRITSFNEQTDEGLVTAFTKAQQEIGQNKIKGYILDLRNNPGGLLDQAILVADRFLERGEIVSTRGRRPEQTQRRNARPGDSSNGKPIVVLINGGSASASEIVAGALQDHRRALIVGSRSFGKASVQHMREMGDSNGAVKLTTARYYTPSGRSIQARGIAPDIEVLQNVPSGLQGFDSIKGEAGLKGHLSNGDGEDDVSTGSQNYVPLNPDDDTALNFAKNFLNDIAN